ncbi:MAG TPA: bifunctional riboflavin kinase/FAD synthetase [Terriglobia bacterium]|nr:bifunctional riboflavin kinase/FAD synthetase [Terriglobia bacterium]
MRVIHNLAELPKPLAASIVTIGNFDGVHLAHQELLIQVVQAARCAGATPAAITFDPHPTKILAPERAPRFLTSLSQKTRLMERFGIELLLVLPFTRELSHLSPADFAREVLGGPLRPRQIFVGPNFRFGHRQSGDDQTLAELGRAAGFSVKVLPMIKIRGERVSSSRIRELLAAGRVTRAGRLLGRPYSSSGPIVPGSGIGKKQTVPTANLAPIEEQLPRGGVYVTRTRLGDALHQSVTNLGTKPTFGEHRLTVECFLLNFSGVIAETEMEVEYLYRLRDEMKFPEASALKTQIQKDAGRSIRLFRLLNRLQIPATRPFASGLSSKM